mgnify:CR=1 FL=1
MADTKKGFNFSEAYIRRMAHCFFVACISRHRCDRRYLCSMFCRSICGNQYSNQSHKDTASNAKILMPKRGISENSSLTTKRSTTQSPHVVTTPKTRPIGIAVLHQFNASKRTKRMVCCLLIPMQRIIPKIGFSVQRCCSCCWKSSNACNQNQQEQNNRNRRRVCPMELPSKSPIEKLPCLPTNRACSIRKPISAILNTAVTINTANTMQSSVIPFVGGEL